MAERVTTAAVLVGGLGTRLRPAVGDCPKPLADVHGAPFLWGLLANLARAGVERVVLLTGYRHERFVETCGDGERWGIHVLYSQETEPLGTGGALRQAWDLCQADGPTDVLLCNGDTFFDGDLTGLLAEGSMPSGCQLRMGLWQPDEDAGRYGQVRWDSMTGQVEAFCEKPSQAPSERVWINAGLYRLSQALDVTAWPASSAFSLEHDVLPRWVASGQVMACPLTGVFFDIGLPTSYQAFLHHTLPQPTQGTSL